MMVDRSKSKCARCGQRPGTIKFGGSLALTHGFAEDLCEVCVLEAQLLHAQERAAAIPKLEARLEAARKAAS